MKEEGEGVDRQRTRDPPTINITRRTTGTAPPARGRAAAAGRPRPPAQKGEGEEGRKEAEEEGR